MTEEFVLNVINSSYGTTLQKIEQLVLEELQIANHVGMREKDSIDRMIIIEDERIREKENTGIQRKERNG